MLGQLAKLPAEVQRRFQKISGANAPSPVYVDSGIPVVPVLEVQRPVTETLMLTFDEGGLVAVSTFQFTYAADFDVWAKFREATRIVFKSVALQLTHSTGVSPWNIEVYLWYLSDDATPTIKDVILGQLSIPAIGTNYSTRYEILPFEKEVPYSVAEYENNTNVMENYNLSEIRGTIKRDGGTQTINPEVTILVDLEF